MFQWLLINIGRFKVEKGTTWRALCKHLLTTNWENVQGGIWHSQFHVKSFSSWHQERLFIAKSQPLTVCCKALLFFFTFVSFFSFFLRFLSMCMLFHFFSTPPGAFSSYQNSLLGSYYCKWAFICCKEFFFSNSKACDDLKRKKKKIIPKKVIKKRQSKQFNQWTKIKYKTHTHTHKNNVFSVSFSITQDIP